MFGTRLHRVRQLIALFSQYFAIDQRSTSDDLAHITSGRPRLILFSALRIFKRTTVSLPSLLAVRILYLSLLRRLVDSNYVHKSVTKIGFKQLKLFESNFSD